MDYGSALVLLGIGFVVGISGAMMPGPLLIYTIQESLKKGKWTGALVILGHAMSKYSYSCSSRSACCLLSLLRNTPGLSA